jgi:hypothetical protein
MCASFNFNCNPARLPDVFHMGEKSADEYAQGIGRTFTFLHVRYLQQ